MRASSEMTLFDNAHVEIRTTFWRGETWYAATDIARLLGYRDAHQAIRLVGEDQRRVRPMPTRGGLQRMSLMSEEGLQVLIALTRSPEARELALRLGLPDRY